MVVHRAPDAEEQSAPDDIAGNVRERKKSSKIFLEIHGSAEVFAS